MLAHLKNISALLPCTISQLDPPLCFDAAPDQLNSPASPRSRNFFQFPLVQAKEVLLNERLVFPGGNWGAKAKPLLKDNDTKRKKMNRDADEENLLLCAHSLHVFQVSPSHPSLHDIQALLQKYCQQIATLFQECSSPTFSVQSKDKSGAIFWVKALKQKEKNITKHPDPKIIYVHCVIVHSGIHNHPMEYLKQTIDLLIQLLVSFQGVQKLMDQINPEPA